MLIVWELPDKSIAITNLFPGVDPQEEIAKINEERPELTFKLLVQDHEEFAVKLDLFFKAIEMQDDNTPAYNMVKARDIWREKIRNDRFMKLKQLDAAYQMALESGDKAKMDSVIADKEVLRNAPNDPAIDNANTLEELQAVYPDLLK